MIVFRPLRAARSLSKSGVRSNRFVFPVRTGRRSAERGSRLRSRSTRQHVLSDGSEHAPQRRIAASTPTLAGTLPLRGTKGAGNKGKLSGKVKLNGKTHEIDFWAAQGIYVLHADFRAVYVGKADAKRLGPRLKDHLTDRFASRWDMFSWFSLSTIVTTYKGVRAPGERQVTAKTLTDTLEALAILVADPALNRKRESLPSAAQAGQVKSLHPQTVRQHLEDILQKLKDGSA